MAKFAYGVTCKECGIKISGFVDRDEPVSVDCPDCLSSYVVVPYGVARTPARADRGLRLCACGRKPQMTAPVEPKIYQVVCECGRKGEGSSTTIGAVEEWNCNPQMGCGTLASFAENGLQASGAVNEVLSRCKIPEGYCVSIPQPPFLTEVSGEFVEENI